MPAILLDKSVKIQTNQIKMEPVDYENDLWDEGIGSWKYATLINCDGSKRTIQPVFLATNDNKGTFYFTQTNEGLFGGTIGTPISITSLDANGLMEEARKILPADSQKGQVKEALEEYLKVIEQDAQFLKNTQFPFISLESGDALQMAGLYGLFYANNIDIESRLIEATTKINALNTKLTNAVNASKAPSNPQPARQHQTTKASTDKRLNDHEYTKMVIGRNKNINLTMIDKMESLVVDTTNEAEMIISDCLKNGENAILKGEPGTGKTAGISSIAKNNGITVFKKNFDDQTDGTDIEGSADLRTNMFTGNQEVGWTEGIIIESAKYAAEACKRGEATITFLDEISRGMSHGKIIGYLSKDPIFKEYSMEYGKPVNMVLLDTDKGELWFEISDEIDRNRQQYKLDANAGISVNNGSGDLQYDGDYIRAIERANRGDLLAITRMDFSKIIDKNYDAIVKTKTGKKCIYVPEFALTFFGATNVNKHGNDQVNDLPNALKSRMPIREVKSPAIKYAVKRSIESEIYLKKWTDSDIDNVTSILVSFFEDMNKIFKAQDRVVGEEIAFRMIADTIKAIAKENPLQGPRSVYNILKNSTALRFAPDTAETPIGEQPKNENVVSAVDTAKNLEKLGVGGIKRKDAAQESKKGKTDIIVDQNSIKTAITSTNPGRI